MKTGQMWIFGLVTLFGLGVLHVAIIEPVVIGQLLPTFANLVNGSTAGLPPIDATTQSEILDNYDHIKLMLRSMTFILFFVVVLYMFIISFRKEEMSEGY